MFNWIIDITKQYLKTFVCKKWAQVRLQIKYLLYMYNDDQAYNMYNDDSLQ